MPGLPVILLALHRHQAEREAAGAAGQANAAMQRFLLAGVVQADAPAEEQQQIFFGRTEAAADRGVAGNVAEVEDAGVLEEELALFRKEQAELREVDLLLVGFGLREVGIDRGVEGQRRRDARLHIDAAGDVAIEAALRRRRGPRRAARNGLMRRLRPCRSGGRPARLPPEEAR